MNKFLSGFVVALIIILMVSCAGLTSKNSGVIGQNSKKQATQNERVATIEKEESKNSDSRLTHIGAWSEGTKYALDKLPDPPKEVVVAKDINERIQALANKPDFNEIKEVRAIIDGLLSEMKEQHDTATKSLATKDEEIFQLGKELQDLNTSKETEIRKALKLSEDTAAKADQYKATLNEMDSFFGFGAIFYGIKKLITRLFWIIIIGLAVFLILRIAAGANPIAAAIFSVFEQIISWFINLLKMIAPKAHQFAGLIEKKVFDGYKDTLVHIIDAIQLLKEKDVGEVDKYTLDDLTEELAKSMDTSDKERIEGIKKELHWK